MLAAMRAQVDVGDRALDERHDRLLDARGVADQREHRPVVRRVGRVVEQAHALHAADGVGHRGDDLGPPSFAHVGNAFDQHEIIEF